MKGDWIKSKIWNRNPQMEAIAVRADAIRGTAARYSSSDLDEREEALYVGLADWVELGRDFQAALGLARGSRCKEWDAAVREAMRRASLADFSRRNILAGPRRRQNTPEHRGCA